MKKVLAIYLIMIVFLSNYQSIFAMNDNRIVFLSGRDRTDGTLDIFILELEGMALSNLTKSFPDLHLHANSAPKINHARNSILFISNEPTALYELSLNEVNIKKIVEIENWATSFAVSQNGKTVVYTEKVNSLLQLFSIDLDEKIPRNVSLNSFNNSEQALSPDGRKIAYVSDADGSNSIYIMNLDGSGKKLLTNHFGEDRFPSFSPNSENIIFCSSRSTSKETDLDIYSIDSTGQNFKLVFQNKSFNSYPSFLLNNTIVFNTNLRGKGRKDIMVFNLSDGMIELLTKNLEYSSSFVSIDNNRELLLFENSGPNDSEIYIYNFSTKVLKNMTEHKSRDLTPSF